MSGDSTAEYRRREDEDEDDDIVESLGERTEGKDEKTDGNLKELLRAEVNENGVRAVVDRVMGPTTSALENLGYSGPQTFEHGVKSFGESLALRNEKMDGNLQTLVHPQWFTEAAFEKNLDDLEQLSGDIKRLEQSSDPSLGFPSVLEARDSDLLAEIDLVSSQMTLWRFEGTFTDHADMESLFKVSWLRDSGKDDAIWESFENVRGDLSDVYCQDAGERLSDLLCQPLSPERLPLYHGMPESESLRDLEFGCPDLTRMHDYFRERWDSCTDLVRESLLSGDREDFDRGMENARESCLELRGARHGGIPFHPNGDGLSESAIEGLEYRRREADLEAEMGVYLLVSLSGHGAENGVPVWNEEMKGVFEEHFYNEHLNVVPEGHLDHEWPWNSENFQNLKYDELVNDQEFLEQFREVTRGMLGGEQGRMVDYMMGRLAFDHDQDDLYERLMHSTGDSRMAGLSGA